LVAPIGIHAALCDPLLADAAGHRIDRLTHINAPTGQMPESAVMQANSQRSEFPPEADLGIDVATPAAAATLQQMALQTMATIEPNTLKQFFR